MRLPLAIPLDARNSDETLDARMSNMLVEQYEDKHYVVNRGALRKLADQTGAANGVMAFNGELISLYGATVFSGSGGDFYEFQKILSSDIATGDFFGFATVISADGSTIAVGATSETSITGGGINGGQGAVYIFVKSGTTWIEQGKIVASDPASTDSFGSGIALSHNGNTLAVGAVRKDTDTGAVYVFTRSGTVWSQEQKIVASDAETSAFFGVSVSLSEDGNTLAVGAYLDSGVAGSDNGAAYVFTRSGTTWSEQQKLLASDSSIAAHFGIQVSLSSNGNVLAVGSEQNIFTSISAAYVFTRSGTTWSEQQKITPDVTVNSDKFGFAVFLDSSGTKLVVGAYAGRAVYIFEESGGVWSQVQKLTASDTVASDMFGYSVCGSGDLQTIIVGAYFGVSGVGKVYSFVFENGSWGEVSIVTSSDTANQDFGGFISLNNSGSTFISGAFRLNTNSGAAYIFTSDLTQIDTVSAGTYDFAQTST